jgi:hypothetical protein
MHTQEFGRVAIRTDQGGPPHHHLKGPIAAQHLVPVDPYKCVDSMREPAAAQLDNQLSNAILNFKLLGRILGRQEQEWTLTQERRVITAVCRRHWNGLE